MLLEQAEPRDRLGRGWGWWDPHEEWTVPIVPRSWGGGWQEPALRVPVLGLLEELPGSPGHAPQQDLASPRCCWVSSAISSTTLPRALHLLHRCSRGQGPCSSPQASVTGQWVTLSIVWPWALGLHPLGAALLPVTSPGLIPEVRQV